MHPSDTVEYLSQLHFDGLDFLEIAFRFEKALGVRFNIDDVFDKRWAKPESNNFTLRDLVTRFLDKYPSLPPPGTTKTRPKTSVCPPARCRSEGVS
ncbi:MAG: acyl carrier protein, partial [Phycisphaerae bacterium]